MPPLPSDDLCTHERIFVPHRRITEMNKQANKLHVTTFPSKKEREDLLSINCEKTNSHPWPRFSFKTTIPVVLKLSLGISN